MNTALPPGLAACRKIIGGESDPFHSVWRDLPKEERAFWLSCSRRSVLYSERIWQDIPGEVRSVIKNNLYRAAKRAEFLLAPCQEAA